MDVTEGGVTNLRAPRDHVMDNRGTATVTLIRQTQAVRLSIRENRDFYSRSAVQNCAITVPPAQPARWCLAWYAKSYNLKQSVVNGAQGRNRTTDTRIFSPLLYQLSYLGVPDATATLRQRA